MTRVEREAADWLTILSKISVTTDNLNAFQEWRKDPEHRRIYDAMAGSVDPMDTLRDQVRRLHDQAAFVSQMAIFAAGGVVALTVTGGMILFVAHPHDTFAYVVAAVVGVVAGVCAAGYLDRELRLRSH